MIKKLLFAAALLSLALASGCATGGSGPGPAIVVKVNAPIVAAYVTQTVTFTATVTNTSNTAVTWSLSGTACTGSPNPCGSIVSATPTTGTYTAPSTAPNPNTVSIVATSAADNKTTGSDTITVDQVTITVTPTSANVGVGLTQQFTAVAVPDDAPQAFTWSILNCSSGCGTVDQNGLYNATGATAGSTVSVQAAVPPSLDPSGFNSANVTVVTSRLGGNASSSTYAFRFSGFDNAHEPTALVGNFVVGSGGQTITSGIEDAVTVSGGFMEYTTVTGTYTRNPPSNDQGSLTLHASNMSGSIQDTFTVVFDAAGDIQMIESDGNGTGSGVIEPVTSKFKDNTSLPGPFVFGFTGMDALTAKRVGYAGLVNFDGQLDGMIASGQLDINDGSTVSTASDITGTYTMANGIGTMQFTSPSLGKTFKFNLYGVSGTNNGNNPLTLYAVSTDASPTGSNPGVSGTVVFQDPKGSPYNNSTMNAVSVASLTGADKGGTNVSLTLMNLDGAGNENGNFDQNDAGTILSVGSFSTGYTYIANGSPGRYTMQLLGNPTAANPVGPLTFILYASGNGRGFLLDQSSPSVITGTLTPQGKGGGSYSASQLPGTFAAATTSSGASGVSPLAANLLFTWANPTQGVSGTEFVGTSGPQALTGTYTLTDAGGGTGGGTAPAVSEFTLTAPAAETYAIYVGDTSGCTKQFTFCTLLDFYAIDIDSANTFPSVIFAHQ
jgi:hypothetical protein